MNKLIEDKLARINDDELLIKAMRYIFNKRVDEEKPLSGETNDDIVLGQKYRAYTKARDMIDKAFNDLSGYKVVNKKPKTFNKER